MQRHNHALGALKLRRARVSSVLTVAREPHRNQGRTDTKEHLEQRLYQIEHKEVTARAAFLIVGAAHEARNGLRCDIGEEVHYGTLCVSVERAFKNSPDDRPEVYAYVKIQENEVTQFENWLFASSPSANLFVHAVYDVRVEF